MCIGGTWGGQRITLQSRFCLSFRVPRGRTRIGIIPSSLLQSLLHFITVLLAFFVVASPGRILSFLFHSIICSPQLLFFFSFTFFIHPGAAVLVKAPVICHQVQWLFFCYLDISAGWILLIVSLLKSIFKIFIVIITVCVFDVYVCMSRSVYVEVGEQFLGVGFLILLWGLQSNSSH